MNIFDSVCCTWFLTTWQACIFNFESARMPVARLSGACQRQYFVRRSWRHLRRDGGQSYATVYWRRRSEPCRSRWNTVSAHNKVRHIFFYPSDVSDPSTSRYFVAVYFTCLGDILLFFVFAAVYGFSSPVVRFFRINLIVFDWQTQTDHAKCDTCSNRPHQCNAFDAA